ncbi:852_t:CDS:2 [Scutellospora calospora]|uniref:852_t:CDS:1 n=1 Tax=Scutellospora calospora TaxID=85575 RepID=A0ACA9L5Z5_9GLOM|nr:852_t:CDS:2 [Scutellospora calospora]
MAIRYVLDSPHICNYCIAKLFSNKTEEICCLRGKLYIYDTEHEVDNRLTIMPKLCRDTLEVIRSVLNHYNPFVADFHSITSCGNIIDLRLLIRANNSLDQRTYNAPTASQVAAI